MRILVAGGRGFISRRLRRQLSEAGHELTVVSRSPESGDIAWDPDAGVFDRSAVEGQDIVVNTVGESISGRLTAAKKKRIEQSRTIPTRLLAEAIAAADRPPRALVNMSAINFYGDRGDEVLDEEAEAGAGFLTEVVEKWESATEPAQAAGARVVLARTSIVIGRGGAGFDPLYRLFWFGLGGRIGSGEQYWSWISLDDVARAFTFLIERDDLAGPVNVTAPVPLRNRDFTKAMGRAMGRPTLLAVPAFALHLVLGRETPDELLLASQRVVPRRLEQAGFEFRHRELGDALAEIV